MSMREMRLGKGFVVVVGLLLVITAPAAQADDYYLGDGAGSDETDWLTAGAWSYDNEIIGGSGIGTLHHSGGTNTVAVDLYLGYTEGGRGTYNLSGTGVLSAVNEYVGLAGHGWFAQTGGTNSVSGELRIGILTSGSGSYTLDSGLLDVADGMIRILDNAALTQNGGTVITDVLNIQLSGTYTCTGANAILRVNTLKGLDDFSIPGSLHLGHAGGSGASTLFGDPQSIGVDLIVGFDASAEIDRSNRTCTIGGNLIPGLRAGASGTCTWEHGTLDVRDGEVVIGDEGAGTLHLHGAPVSPGLLIANKLRLGGAGLLTADMNSAVLVNELTCLGGSYTTDGCLYFGHAGGGGRGHAHRERRGRALGQLP